jgi:hypothetical protein
MENQIQPGRNSPASAQTKPSPAQNRSNRAETSLNSTQTNPAWQQLIRHVAAMITVVVVAPSGLRKFLPRWTPFGHFSLPTTSRINKFLS